MIDLGNIVPWLKSCRLPANTLRMYADTPGYHRRGSVTEATIKDLLATCLQILLLLATPGILGPGTSTASVTPARTAISAQKQDRQEETVYITSTGQEVSPGRLPGSVQVEDCD
jgi:hypothetical protein